MRHGINPHFRPVRNSVTVSFVTCLLAAGQTQPQKQPEASAFQQSGAGALTRTIDEKMRDVISVKDFTKGDGVTIDTAGFTNALNAARGSGLKEASGVAIYVPALQGGKCYQIDRPITIEAWNGFEMYGGGWGSCLQAVGTGMRSVIYLKGSYSGHLRNLHIMSTPAHPVTSLIEMTQGPSAGPGHTSQGNLLEDIWLDGQGAVTDAVLVDGEDQNNDFQTFVRLLVQGFTDAAFKLVGSQSYSHKFLDCRVSGYYRNNGGDHWGGYAVKAISSFDDTKTGSRGAASFTWTGGGIGVGAYDFYISGYSAFPYEISDVNSESAGGQLLYANGTPSYIIVRGVRFSRTRADSNTDFIHVEGASLLINNLIATSFTATAKADMTMYYSASGNPNGQPQLTIEDSEVVTSRKTPETFFHSNQPPSSFLSYRNFAILSLDALTNTLMGGVRSYSPSARFESLQANHLEAQGWIQVTPRKVAELGNAPQGAIAFVTDSTTNQTGARVAGGGSYSALVASPDGRNWFIVGAADGK